MQDRNARTPTNVASVRRCGFESPPAPVSIKLCLKQNIRQLATNAPPQNYFPGLGEIHPFHPPCVLRFHSCSMQPFFFYRALQEYKPLFEGTGNNPGDKTLEDKFFEHEVRFCVSPISLVEFGDNRVWIIISLVSAEISPILIHVGDKRDLLYNLFAVWLN